MTPFHQESGCFCDLLVGKNRYFGLALGEDVASLACLCVELCGPWVGYFLASRVSPTRFSSALSHTRKTHHPLSMAKNGFPWDLFRDAILQGVNGIPRKTLLCSEFLQRWWGGEESPFLQTSLKAVRYISFGLGIPSMSLGPSQGMGHRLCYAYALAT